MNLSVQSCKERKEKEKDWNIISFHFVPVDPSQTAHATKMLPCQHETDRYASWQWIEILQNPDRHNTDLCLIEFVLLLES